MTGKPEGVVGGAATYIDRDKYLLPIAEKYGRDPTNLYLKICYQFLPDPGQRLEDIGWCGSPLPVLDCARLQNICYWRGLAPRVYAVDMIEWEGTTTIAMLMDYVGEGEPRNTPLFKEVCKVIEEYGGFHEFSHTSGNTWNSAGGKWLAFKAAGFKDKTAYEEKIGVDKATTSRKFLEFSIMDFGGRTVLDTKCEYGLLCNHLSGFGAKRVVGVTDQPDVCRQLSNYYGHFNIDYVEDPKESDIQHFDFVF